MRADFPDYKAPIFSTFRALAVLTGVMILGGVILGVAHFLFHPSHWVARAFFIALGVSGIATALISPLGLVRAEARAKAAGTTKQATPTAAPKPRRWVTSAMTVLLFAGVLGIPILIVGLVAHLTALAVCGAAFVGLFLAETGLLYPARQARRSARKQG